MSDSAEYITGCAEITLDGERAVYSGHNVHENGHLDNGFANPLYAVMQPRPSDTSQLQPQQNGRSSGGGANSDGVTNWIRSLSLSSSEGVFSGGGGDIDGANDGAVA